MVFSDLLTDPEPIFQALHRLRHRGHDVILFHVLDEAEVRFPFEGMVELEEPESRERLTLARECGADAVVNAKETDPVAALRELTHGDGVETAMDCTGSPEARVAAVRSACTWGRVCFVGEGNTTTFDISQDMIRKQLTIHASWTFSSVGQDECARFVANRKIALKRLLTHRFKLEQADEAYRLFDTQTTGKGVFLP